MQHLERGLDGQNQWWKYPLMFLLVVFLGNIVGILPLVGLVAIMALAQGDEVIPGVTNFIDYEAYGVDPAIGLALFLLPFAMSFLFLKWLLPPLHKRSLMTVINGERGFRWSRAGLGFAFWFGLLALYLIIYLAFDGGSFEFRSPPAGSFMLLIVVSFLLIPVQSGFEEVFFRGYLAQGVAAWTKNRWAVLLITSVLFGLMHGLNPEIDAYGFAQMMPQYVLFGLILGLACLLDDGTELAIGAHSANNIFNSLFVTTQASALQTPALLEQTRVFPLIETAILFAVGVVFIALIARRSGWSFEILNQKIDPLSRSSNF